MAVLTFQNMAKMLKSMKQDQAGWDAQMSEHPNKNLTLALVQGLDDWYEANRLAAKTAMEAEAGISISNILAKKYGKAWMAWKFGGE